MVKSCKIVKPASVREPLPSMAITTSIFPTQTSSPTQACVLQSSRTYRSGSSSFQHLPRPRSDKVTDFSLYLNPVAHAFEHGVNSLHSESEQSRSQVPELHVCDSCKVSQAFPAFFGRTSIVRVCDCTPPPHSTEHFDHPDHSVSSQSI